MYDIYIYIYIVVSISCSMFLSILFSMIGDDAFQIQVKAPTLCAGCELDTDFLAAGPLMHETQQNCSRSLHGRQVLSFPHNTLSPSPEAVTAWICVNLMHGFDVQIPPCSGPYADVCFSPRGFTMTNAQPTRFGLQMSWPEGLG